MAAAPSPPSDSSWVTESPDRPQVPAEIVFLLVVLTITLFFSLAGIPGEAEPVAGDGSPALEQGWLEEHEAATRAARQDAAASAPVGAPAGSADEARQTLDPEGGKRY